MKLLSVKEAADRLSISVGLVYSLCKSRLLRHERPGLKRGTIRIPEDALEEYRRRVSVGIVEAPSTPPPAKTIKLKHLA